jgi:hypothetical protein
LADEFEAGCEGLKAKPAITLQPAPIAIGVCFFFASSKKERPGAKPLFLAFYFMASL